MLVIVGGCNGGSGPAAAKETAACDGVPQMALAGRVTDAANILPAEDEARLGKAVDRGIADEADKPERDADRNPRQDHADQRRHADQADGGRAHEAAPLLPCRAGG